MSDIAPGSILQRMYFSQRVKGRSFKSFCEVGSGNGILSNLLLKKGLTGMAYDLNASACENNRSLNEQFILENKYVVRNEDFLENNYQEKFDLIFSCMVIEHLTDEELSAYIAKCKKSLSPRGIMAFFVPASMKYWGIEDEIAGHVKRYEFNDFNILAERNGCEIIDVCGLTYPVSNWLFKMSNWLIAKNESHKKGLNIKDRTVLSGNRGVKFKTVFPFYFRLILNPVVLFPFYILQRLFRNNQNSMVIYCEMSFDKLGLSDK